MKVALIATDLRAEDSDELPGRPRQKRFVRHAILSWVLNSKRPIEPSRRKARLRQITKIANSA